MLDDNVLVSFLNARYGVRDTFCHVWMTRN